MALWAYDICDMYDQELIAPWSFQLKAPVWELALSNGPNSDPFKAWQRRMAGAWWHGVKTSW